MKKKGISVLLSLAVAMSVAACGSSGSGNSGAADSPAEDTESAAADTGTQENAEDAGDAAQEAIEERKSSGEYPLITMAMLSFTGPSDGAERVNQLINDYTEETYGISVEILNYDVANYTQQLQLAFASGEPIDLFSAVSIGYSNSINTGYTYDLEQDDLIQTYGQGILEAVGDNYIETCRVNGTLYGVPNMKEYSNGIGGFFVPKKYLDEIGYDYETALSEQGSDTFVLPDTILCDYDLVDEIFAKLHEAYPDKYVFGPQSYEKHAVEVDSVGGDLFGVLFSDSEDTTLQNLFENEDWLEYLRHVYQWNQAGYISPDALTDTTDINTKVAAGEILTFLSNVKPGQSTAYNAALGGMVIFQTGGYFSASNAVNDMPWCIGSNCEDPIAAMQLLNAFYTDPVLENLICWGEENVDYVVDENGLAAYPEGKEYDDIEYKLGVSWEMPNQFISYISNTSSPDLWDQYNEMNSAAKQSIVSGFIFDNSSVQNEYIALTNIWSEYQPQLMYGFVDPDETTPELIQKLEDAGYETYVAEKQKQLDAWLAER